MKKVMDYTDSSYEDIQKCINTILVEIKKEWDELRELRISNHKEHMKGLKKEIKMMRKISMEKFPREEIKNG